MDWPFEADRDAERRFPWISIPGVASNRLETVDQGCVGVEWREHLLLASS